MLTAIPCTLMRGGTSKGLYFHADDLPAERQLFDRVLLAAMGSPTFGRSTAWAGASADEQGRGHLALEACRCRCRLLFLQVVVDKPEVSDSQNCGNLLAAG